MIILNVFPPCVKFVLIGGADPFLDQDPEIREFSNDEMAPDSAEHVPPAIEYMARRVYVAYGVDLPLISICHKDRW